MKKYTAVHRVLWSLAALLAFAAGAGLGMELGRLLDAVSLIH